MLRLLRSLCLPLCLALSPLAGCQALAPTAPTAVAAKRQVVVAGDRTLMVRPQLGGYRTQSAVSAYGKDDIAHLLLKLYVVDGEEEVEAVTADNQPIERDLLNDPTTPEDELAVSVAIAGLKPNTTYRVKAIAYKAAGFNASDIISTQDAQSYVTVTLTDDDRPTMEALKVQLVSRDVSMRLLGTNTQLSDARMATGTHKERPRLAFGSGGRYLMVWAENRSGHYDVYGQLFTGGGAPVGAEIPICTTAGDQKTPTVAYNSQADEFLVAWGGSDVWGRRLAADGSFPTTGVTAIFAIATAGNLQELPVVAYNSQADEYLVAWQDKRSGSYDIYGQRVGADGSLLDTGASVNFALCTAGTDQINPAIAYNSQAGEVLVTWQDNRNGNFDIYGQRVSAAGSLLDPTNFAICTAGNLQESPVVAYNGQADEYLAAWRDRRSGNYDIYGQRLSAAGSLLGASDPDDFAICTATDTQVYPTVAYNSQADEYLVAWQDMRDGHNNVYGQRMSASGDLLGNTDPGVSFAICTATGIQQFPTVAYNSLDDELVVAWQDDRNGNWDIFGLRIGSSFAATDGGAQMVASYLKPASDERPRVAFGSGDRYMVVWQDNRLGNYDIYGRLFNRDGTPAGAEFAVSTAANGQQRPTVAYSSQADEFLVTWHDSRSGGWDIYGQRVKADGSLPTAGVTGNFAICTAAGTQQYPDVTYNSQADEYLVAWHDSRNGTYDIYGQRVKADGSLPTAGVTGNFAICTAAGHQLGSTVAYNDQANEYLVTWFDSRSGAYDIYGQRVGADGSLPTAGVTGNFAISTAADSQYYPTVAYNRRADEYLVAWHDDRSGTYDIYGQRVMADGSLPTSGVTGNFTISTAANDQQFATISYNGQAGEFLVTWFDSRSGNSDIYGQRLSGSGALIGDSPAINFAISTAPADQRYPTIAYDSQANEFLVVWQDDRDGNTNVYGQRLDSFIVP